MLEQSWDQPLATDDLIKVGDAGYIYSNAGVHDCPALTDEYSLHPSMDVISKGYPCPYKLPNNKIIKRIVCAMWKRKWNRLVQKLGFFEAWFVTRQKYDPLYFENNKDFKNFYRF